MKGARPGDIPVVHPSPYDLVIDTRAAARIGLKIPDAAIAQALESEVLRNAEDPPNEIVEAASEAA